MNTKLLPSVSDMVRGRWADNLQQPLSDKTRPDASSLKAMLKTEKGTVAINMIESNGQELRTNAMRNLGDRRAPIIQAFSVAIRSFLSGYCPMAGST